MDLPLSGQVAIITGGNTGIGAAICRSLASRGAFVIINYLGSEEEAVKLREELNRITDAEIFRADVSNEKEVQSMFEFAKKKAGRLDILISNAGIQKDNSLAGMSIEEWQEVININLTGGFLCAREAARVFLKQELDAARSKSRGKIIFISSVHDVIPWSGHINYAASKGGMDMLMRSAAQELAQHRIRVNSISPGAVKTSINKDEWDTRKDREKLLELIPYGRIGEPEDVAGVAAWLCTDEADYITGTTLYVDGGMTLYPAFRNNG